MSKKCHPIANWILTLSNAGAFYTTIQCFNHDYPLLGITVLFAGAASILFHSCESHKHDVLPGLWQVSLTQEKLILNIDRLFAIVAGTIMGVEFGFARLAGDVLVWIAIFSTLFSELRYIGVLTIPEWDSIVYPIFHSIWHVLVFAIPLKYI